MQMTLVQVFIWVTGAIFYKTQPLLNSTSIEY